MQETLHRVLLAITVCARGTETGGSRSICLAEQQPERDPRRAERPEDRADTAGGPAIAVNNLLTCLTLLAVTVTQGFDVTCWHPELHAHSLHASSQTTRLCRLKHPLDRKSPRRDGGSSAALLRLADAATAGAPAPEPPKRQTLRSAKASEAQAERPPTRKTSRGVFAASQAAASSSKVHLIHHSWCSYCNLVLMLAHFIPSDVCFAAFPVCNPAWHRADDALCCAGRVSRAQRRRLAEPPPAGASHSIHVAPNDGFVSHSREGGHAGSF